MADRALLETLIPVYAQDAVDSWSLSELIEFAVSQIESNLHARIVDTPEGEEMVESELRDAGYL